MARSKSNTPSKSSTPAPSTQPHAETALTPASFQEVFALENVAQLRQAVDQAVYGEAEDNKTDEEQRERTVEGLTTLGQMGMLTETDIDEAKKGYL